MAAMDIFQSAQRIIKQMFDWLQLATSTRISNLIADTFQAGIDNATLSGEGFTIIQGTNNTSLNPSVTVQGQGIAYDPVGNRIFIASTDTTLFDPTAPADTTNDGLGNLLSTPQSTGCVNIPLTQSSLNYIWIDYLGTIDTTAYTLNKITLAKQFYKQTDGYEISVTTINVAPDATSIFLGSVDMTGGGAVQSSNISLVGRKYFNILPNIVPITTALADRSDATAVYNTGSTYVLETHIKAVGTGIVGPKNPHGTSLGDLGISSFDTVAGHRQLEHGNAIIAGTPSTPYPSTSAMATSINVVNPGSDYLTVDQLLSSEFAIINGTAYTVFDIFGAVPSNARVNFPTTPGSSGTYNVYWDSLTGFFGTTTGDISGDLTKLWIATVTWNLTGAFSITGITSSVILQVSSTTGMNIGDTIVQGAATTTITSVDSSVQIHVVSTTGFVNGNALDTSLHNSLSSLVDRRRIGSTTHLMERWLNSARPGVGAIAPLPGEFGFNMNSNLLEFWDGATWQQPVTTSSFATVPTGTLLPFAGGSAPSGFLLANGSVVSQITFAALFSVIGTLYNTGGEGAGNFRLPNMINNVPIGAGSIASLGVTVGAATHTLTTAEIPASLTVTDPGHEHVDGTSQGLDVAAGGSGPFLQTAGGGGPSHSTNSSPTGITVGGGGGSHNIVQPSLGITYIIKI